MKQINAQARIQSQHSIEYSNRDAVQNPAHSRLSHSRTAYARSPRRRGQALLITVLLMVFASVLAATFVTVVALNLSQTARSGSVASAKQAALAGKNFVNDQLTNSELGERWTEIDAQTPPLASAPEYAFYYTDFERAQGWDQQGFVKFPNPLSPTTTANGSSVFLTKVTDIIDSATAASLGLTNDYIGQLKVDVIGRATDNDATFSKLTFYKPTSRNGNMNGFARYVSNWNFAKNTTLQTKWSTSTSVPINGNNVTQLTVSSTQGFAPGRAILVGQNLPQAAIVRSVDTTNRTITLNTTITTTAGDTLVRAATPFVGTLANFDARGDSTATEGTDDPQYNAFGGMMIQSAMYFENNTKTLLDLDTTTAGRSADKILVSGPILKQGTAVAQVRGGAANALEDITGTSTLSDFVRYDSGTAADPTSRQLAPRSITPARIDKPFSRWLNKTRYSGDAGEENGYGGGVYINNAEDVEKVARYEPNPAYPGFGQPNPLYIAPVIVKNYRNLTISEQQRLLQRKTFAAVNAGTYDDPSTPLIDPNERPVEPGNLAGLRASAPFGYTGAANGFGDHRYSYERLGVDDNNFFPYNGSLEQRGLRGWVSQYEYLPRGVLVELRGNEIVITRDDMSDVRSSRPDETKAWRRANGRYLTDDGFENGAPRPGARTYRMKLAMDGTRSFGADEDLEIDNSSPAFNGVIYAEGNIRGRGFTNASMRDLTIVSMSSIYIEGGINQLSTTQGKVALLAKNNVILNPTQFAQRISGSRNNAASGVASVATLVDFTITPNAAPLTDVRGIRIGDFIRFSNETVLHRVTRVRSSASPGTYPNDSGIAEPGTIEFTTALTADVPALTSIDILTDPNVVVDNNTGRRAFQLTGSNSILARNLARDGVAPGGTTYLSVVHAGEINRAVDLYREDASTQGELATPGDARLKFDVNSDGVIDASEKTLFAADSPGSAVIPALTLPSPDTYDLRDAGINGGVSADAVDTVGLLSSFFNFRALTPEPPYTPGEDLTPETEDRNRNWDFLPPFTGTPLLGPTSPTALTSTVAARRLAAFSLASIKAGTSRPVFQSTSAGIYMNPVFGTFNAGSTPTFTVGSSFNPLGDEEVRTVDESFYTRTDLATQAALQGMGYSTAITSDSNVVALRHRDDFGADYRVSVMKLDRDTLATVATTPITVNVEAIIYAQEGSWFVIPMPAITPNNAVPTAAEIVEAERYRRLNYQIVVKANIAENFVPTATVDYDENQSPDDFAPTTNTALPLGRGAQAQWIDSSSRPTPTAWQTIIYDRPMSLPITNTLLLPITPDITLQR